MFVEKTGHVFTRVWGFPYVTVQGELTHVSTWMTHCAKCGKPFYVDVGDRKTPATSKSFLVRHCAKHKRRPNAATRR